MVVIPLLFAFAVRYSRARIAGLYYCCLFRAGWDAMITGQPHTQIAPWTAEKVAVGGWGRGALVGKTRERSLFLFRFPVWEGTGSGVGRHPSIPSTAAVPLPPRLRAPPHLPMAACQQVQPSNPLSCNRHTSERGTATTDSLVVAIYL